MNAHSPPDVGTPIAARFIGQRMPRKEDARLLTGGGTYVDDVVVAGMLHAAFVRSPMARGRILKVDTAVAAALPGVHAILTAQDLERFNVSMLSFYMTPVGAPLTPLAYGDVRYAGHPVAIVVAQDRATAEDAASLVQVDYEELEPVVSIDDARHGPAIHPGMEANVAALMGDEEIDEGLDALMAGAAHLVEASVHHQRISQSPMETRGVVAHPHGEGELTLHITCQSPHAVARYMTLALGHTNMAIRVLARDVGGSFGLKNHPWLEEMSAILAALHLNRPVKWIEDRLENLTCANNCREQQMRLRAAFDADGRLVAAHGDYDSNNGAFPQGEDANIAVHMFMWAAYKMPAYGFVTRAWYTNTQGLSAYRGPWAMESLARETLLDRAARQIGMDPIEIRRRNLIRRSELPVTTSLGLPMDDISPAECLDKLLEVVDVAAFRAEQAAARKEGRYLGLGIAAYVEPTGSAGSIPVMTGELAQLRIEPTGKVTAMMSTHSQGHGTQTTMAQIIAEQLGVPYESVTVFEGDSSRGGFSPGAAGSRQGVIAGGAALKASALLAGKVRRLAGHLLNASPEDILLEGGMVRVRGVEEQTRTLEEIAAIAYGEPARLPPGVESGLEAQHRYDPPPMTFTSAAHACIVEVDPDTGFVTIRRWVSSEDCGVMINPAIVEGQIAGGLAQAIGMVLLEEAGYDERGNPVAATFKDYHLPQITDIPDFEYVHANVPSQSEGGFRGVGEGGAIIGPPTLVNAIADALAPFGEIGAHLPLTPSKLLDHIEGRAPKPARPSRFATQLAPAPAAPVHAPALDVADIPASAVVLPGGMEALAAEAAELATLPPAPAATADRGLAGDWKMVIHSPMGAQAMTARIEVDGARASGSLDSDQGSMAFDGGVVDGSRLRFELKVTKPMSLTLKYDLEATGDSLAGKVKMGVFGTSKVSGERVG